MYCCHISVQNVKYSLIYKAGGAIFVQSVYICNVPICIFLEFRVYIYDSFSRRLDLICYKNYYARDPFLMSSS